MSHSSPVDQAAVEALRGWDTPTLANAVETFGARPANQGFMDSTIRGMFAATAPLLGFAATATIRSATPYADEDVKQTAYEALYRHVAEMPKPCVLVVQDLDAPNQSGCLWGEVNSTVFQRLGAGGVITDGLVRDLVEVEALGFGYFAAGVGVSHSYVRVEQVGLPVTVGGLSVGPGDLMHADQHGVLSVPAELVTELPAAAQRVIDQEQRFLSWVRSAEFSLDELRTRRVAH